LTLGLEKRKLKKHWEKQGEMQQKMGKRRSYADKEIRMIKSARGSAMVESAKTEKRKRGVGRKGFEQTKKTPKPRWGGLPEKNLRKIE